MYTATNGHNLAHAYVYQLFPLQVVFCICAYLLNLAPYLQVKRSTLIYHYMPALLYAELLAARTLEVRDTIY